MSYTIVYRGGVQYKDSPNKFHIKIQKIKSHKPSGGFLSDTLALGFFLGLSCGGGSATLASLGKSNPGILMFVR